MTWATSYESPYGDSMIYHLAVDGAGEIVLGGQAGGDLVIDEVTIEGPEGLMDFMESDLTGVGVSHQLTEPKW